MASDDGSTSNTPLVIIILIVLIAIGLLYVYGNWGFSEHRVYERAKPIEGQGRQPSDPETNTGIR